MTQRLLKEAAELGLTAIDIPEEYGGLEMDKVTSAIVAENIAKQAQLFGCFFGACGDWDAAAGVVRHAGAEEEVSAEDRFGEDRLGVCVVGVDAAARMR